MGRKGAPQNSDVQGGEDSETGPQPSDRDEQGCWHERQQQQRDAFSDLSSHWLAVLLNWALSYYSHWRFARIIVSDEF
jgi:hypothetical protein